MNFTQRSYPAAEHAYATALGRYWQGRGTDFAALDDAGVRARTAWLQGRLAAGETLGDQRLGDLGRLGECLGESEVGLKASTGQVAAIGGVSAAVLLLGGGAGLLLRRRGRA